MLVILPLIYTRVFQGLLHAIVRHLTSAFFPACFRAGGFTCSFPFPFAFAVSISRPLAFWSLSIFICHRYHLLASYDNMII